jgi:hypothetical protein
MSDRGRVVVAGGSGLIGSALTRELAGAGYDVVVLSRSPEEVEGLPDGARAVGWDGATADGWGGEAEGAAGIVNLAGANLAGGLWTEARKRVLRASRLESTGALVQAVARAAARGAAPRALLQGSAVGYYGSSGDRELTEESPPGDDFLARLTADWEAASTPAADRGVRRVLLRSGVVLSAQGGALPKMALPFKLFVGGPVGDGSQWVPWIHLRDEARAIRFLLEHAEAAGPFNLVAPEPATNRQLSRRLARALHRPSLLCAPRIAVRAVLGELADTVLTSQRVVPRRLAELGFTWEYPELERALAALVG